MKNMKKSLLFLSVLIFSSCNTKNNSTLINNSNNNQVTNIKSSNISHVEVKTDEDLIKELINNNSEFFPLDLNGDNSSKATVPNNGGVIFATVPNNGGVIFLDDTDSFSIKSNSYSTKQLRLPIRNIPIPKPKLVEKIKENIPLQWSREVIDKPKREVEIFFESDLKARAIVKTFFNRKLVLNFENNREIVKKLNEVSTRIAYFKKENNKWILESISPFEFIPENKNINVSIETIKLTVKSNEKETIFNIPTNNLISKKDIPIIKKGDILKIEVKAINKEPNEVPPLYVYLRLPNIALKIPMYDDGSLEDLFIDKDGKQVSTDSISNDDIYTTTIKISKNLGINNITIDAISSLSLQDSLDNGDYISKSFPIIIK